MKKSADKLKERISAIERKAFDYQKKSRELFDKAEKLKQELRDLNEKP